MLLQKRKPYKKKVPTGPASTAGEAIEKMLVEKKISSKINYEVLRDLETSQSSRPTTPVTPVPKPVLPLKQEFIMPRVPTRTGGRKRLVSNDYILLGFLWNTYGLLAKCEFKMAGYWPSSFFASLLTETKSRFINSKKKNEANIQPS